MIDRKHVKVNQQDLQKRVVVQQSSKRSAAISEALRYTYSNYDSTLKGLKDR